MSAILTLPDSYINKKQVHGVEYDFKDAITLKDGLTTLVADGGSVAPSDAAGGVVILTTGTTDNDEVCLNTTKELFLFAADKPMECSFLMGCVEANTDDASVFMGVVDAPGANLLVDDGAGPKTTASGMAFEKRDGETEWRAWSSLGTTQTSTLLEEENKNNLSGSDQTVHSAGPTHLWYTIRFNPLTSTDAEITFEINNILVAKHSSFTFTSATEMALAVYVKAGGANAEVPQWDYMAAYQKR